MISALGPIIAAVITGVLGLYAGALKGAPGVPSPTPSVSVSTTTVTVPATATPSESGSGGGARALYHEGRLQLAFATCVDLDAPTGDPQWGESSSTSGGVDFCSESPGFAGVNGATIVTVDSGTDTTCQNATGWLRENAYQNLNLSVGSLVCVHTNQGRFSLLRTDAIDSTSLSVTFTAKTFKKPGD